MTQLRLSLPKKIALPLESGDPDSFPEILKYFFFMAMGFLLMAMSFLFNSPGEIWAGNVIILTSAANLVTDYFKLANIGATLMNAGIMTLLSLGIVRINRVKITGSIVAAIFTITGFSFFGKNLYNSVPIVLGVLLYARLVRLPFNRFLLQSLFGTALGPLVSEVTFNLNLTIGLGLVLGVAAGVLAGFLLPPLSVHFLKFHQGYNLYNIGFTAGIVGTFFLAVLRGFGIQITTVSILSEGNNLTFAIMLYSLFGIMLILGFYLNRWRWTDFRLITSQSGVLATDFIAIAGIGPTLINMSLLGLIATSYVLVLGGQINGPVIGGIFTVVGFGAFGKHVRNVLPILGGVFLFNIFNIHDASSTTAMLSALFGTTLAPIAGQYGVGFGVVAGILHMAMVTNIHYLHGGMNLYNNGFAGGFVAAALVPVFDVLLKLKNKE